MSSSSPFVADASAIINLNASQCGPDILRALPHSIVVVNVVVGELEEGKGKGRRDAVMLNDLAAAGVVKIVTLGDIGEGHFERLVVGPAQATLDDGEAATIAYGLEHSVGVIVDDKKARKICAEHFSALPVMSTCDILRDPAVAASLGKDRLKKALYDALQLARMSVRDENLSWVVDVLGEQTACSCRSLPGKRLQSRASAQ